MSKKSFRGALSQLDLHKKNKEAEIPGILGFTVNGVQTVNVPYRPGYVYVRLRNNTSEVIQAFNENINALYNLPVIVVRDEVDKSRYKIKGRDLGAYQNWGTSNLYVADHTHSFFQGFLAFDDAVFIATGVALDLKEDLYATAAGTTISVGVITGTFSRDGHTHSQYSTGSAVVGGGGSSVLVYDDNVFKVTGTALHFNDGLDVIVTGSSAWINWTGTAGSQGPQGISGDNTLLIYDDAVFKVTGTALNFGANINVVVTGSTAYISSVDTVGGGGADLLIYDNSVFKVTGTAIDFGDNLDVAVTGTTAYITAVGVTGSAGAAGIQGLPGDNTLLLYDDNTFITTGTSIHFNDNLSVIVTGSAIWVDGQAGGTGSTTNLGWFNVKDYGAVGDGVIDDTIAINDTITAMNVAGRGVLYFPAGDYLNSGGFTISVPSTILGMGHHYAGVSSDGVSQLLCNSSTGTVFTIAEHACQIRNLSFYNNAVSTPSAGAAITVTAGTRMIIDGVSVERFYNDIDIQDGATWILSNSYIYDPVNYGVKIAHVDQPDGGDWMISNTTLSANNRSGAAAIYMESAGGGKIVNCKINSAGALTNAFDYGIQVAFTDTSDTSILLIANVSIENIKVNGIRFVTGAGAAWGMIQLTGVQISLYDNTDDHAIFIGANSLGDIYDVVINGCVFRAAAASSLEAVKMVKVATGRLSACINHGFTNLLATDTCTDVVITDSVVSSVSDTSTIDLTLTGMALSGVVIPAGIKLDDLGSPDDNTDLNVNLNRHGLAPKGTTGTSQFWRQDWTLAVPPTGNGGGTNLLIYDNSSFIATGTAIDFADNLDVSVTGSIIYINAIGVTGTAGATGPQGIPGPAGSAGANTVYYDDSIFKATGTAVSFDESLDVSVTGSLIYVSSSSVPASGWMPSQFIWTWNSGDDPTYVIETASNLTGTFSNGMRVKVDNATTKYFIVTNVAYVGANTKLTLYGGTDYDLVSGTISNPYYSMMKSPYGFPLSPTKWTVETSDTSNREQSSPVSSTWYNVGSLSITVPIGSWDVSYYAVMRSTHSSQTYSDVRITLSTANNSQSDVDFTMGHYIEQANGLVHNGPVSKVKTLDLTTKTIYYLNIMTPNGATSIAVRGDNGKTFIRAKCAYL